MAYTVAGDDGIRRLHLRSLDTVETRVLPGTEGVLYAFWSPDGRSLAFTSEPDAVLKRIDVSAGSPRDIVNNIGGVATPTQLIDSGGGFPFFLPDGERFLLRNGQANSIELATLGSSARSTVLDNVDSAPLLAPTPSGKTYLLFMRSPDLMAQEFDEAKGTVRGEPIVLVSDIAQVGIPAIRPAVGVSPSGVLAYQTGGPSPGGQHWQWVDRTGARVKLLPEAVSITDPRLSPDETTVAGTRTENGKTDVWTTDLTRLSKRRRTFSVGDERDPVWSPDGAHLAFMRSGSGPKDGLFVLDLDAGSERRVTDRMRPTSWSPDGYYLLAENPEGVWLVPVEGDGKIVAIGSRNGHTSQATFSPNGDYIAFESDESGRNEVYVVPTPPATGRQQLVSINGGFAPRWRADGAELFFVSLAGGSVMAVDVDTGNTFSAGIPNKLFTPSTFLRASGYAVSGDGQRFLVPVTSGDSGGSGDATITVVLN